MLCDCDFMFGEPTPGESGRDVLCEINVSSVSPFPALKARLAQRTR